ncbi:MAG TPA: hypothetical protein PLQ93_04610 [Bacteroidia bacterium]|nr:hypothetical protein [Bacteroidia bacterium]
MKTQIILILGASVLLFTCKKKEPAEFTATDMTGTCTVKGNISKNIIGPNGLGGWTSGARIPAENVSVSVKVNRNSLYPNSNAQGADVYTAKTDKDGNYAMSVKSNASGVIAQISIEGFSGTLDTLVNGISKKGLLCNYNGSTYTTTLYMGQAYSGNYAFTATPVQSNPNTIGTGTALITGSVGLSIVKEIQTGTLVSLTTAFVPLTGHKVYLNLNKDPLTQQQKLYEVNTDANGHFEFLISTVASGTSGFPQNVNLWINDLAATRDTLKLNNTIKPGKPGVYQMHAINLNGVFNSEIKNGNYLLYTVFTPD